MRFRLLLLSIALLFSLPVFAQQLVTAPLSSAASSCQPSTNTTSCVFLAVDPKTNTVGASIAGTYSATLQFQGSADNGATWASVQATPSSGGSAVTSTTTTGTWTISAGGYSFIRVRCSAYSSGVATVTLNPSQAVTVSVSGGGGSGTVTEVDTGTGLTGGPCTTTCTIAIDSTVTTLTGTQALTNKTVDGVTPTTMGFVDPSSSIQSQLNAKTGNIASGTSALGTGAISSATCATVVTTTATGTATTDPIIWGFNGDPTAVTGYVAATSGMLTIIAYPTANNVNFKVCNNTTGSITPGAITLNWKVDR